MEKETDWQKLHFLYLYPLKMVKVLTEIIWNTLHLPMWVFFSVTDYYANDSPVMKVWSLPFNMN